MSADIFMSPALLRNIFLNVGTVLDKIRFLGYNTVAYIFSKRR